MTTAKLAPMAMILALVMAALPASADPRLHGKAKGKGNEIVHLTDRLDDLTHELYHDAANVRGRRTVWARWRALLALHRLDREASQLHQRVSRGTYDRRTRNDFRELERAFHTAKRQLPALRPGRELARDFARAEKLMDRIETRLEVRLARDDQPRHARRDHSHGVAWNRHSHRVAWNRGR